MIIKSWNRHITINLVDLHRPSEMKVTSLSHLRSYKSKKERRQRLNQSRREEFLHGVWPSWYRVKSLRAPHHKKKKRIVRFGMLFRVFQSSRDSRSKTKLATVLTPTSKTLKVRTANNIFPNDNNSRRKGMLFLCVEVEGLNSVKAPCKGYSKTSNPQH